MADVKPDSVGHSQERQMALSRWENEGGAGPGGPQAGRIFAESQSEVPEPTNAELVKLRVRVPTHERVRAFLESIANRRIPITYQELAEALQILPPHSIHQVTEALERLMEEDAAADRPFIAALAISKARGGLPAPGFFDCGRRLGRFADGQDARTFHAAELIAVFARWGDVLNN